MAKCNQCGDEFEESEFVEGLVKAGFPIDCPNCLPSKVKEKRSPIDLFNEGLEHLEFAASLPGEDNTESIALANAYFNAANVAIMLEAIPSKQPEPMRKAAQVDALPPHDRIDWGPIPPGFDWVARHESGDCIAMNEYPIVGPQESIMARGNEEWGFWPVMDQFVRVHKDLVTIGDRDWKDTLQQRPKGGK